MLLTFFTALKSAQIPVTLREYLTLMEALQAGLASYSTEEFYYLARTALVKDERNLDKFDRVFGTSFKGLESLGDAVDPARIPAEWLQKLVEKHLTDEEKAELKALGWDKLMETLRQRLAEQKERHQGGNKWIGTGGTSPYGAYGYNPEGIRIGQDGNRNFRAVKVWDKREFKDLDGTSELGTRNIKMALRHLRSFARTGALEELDLETTIHDTAAKGYLDVHLRPERRNAIKVLLFFDIGGSMDWHIGMVEELFSAAKAEFKHMDFFYFHNCPYEYVWKNNARRHEARLSTLDVLNTYGRDYKVIFVGDASMSPYEILHPGGSVEHMNAEAGSIWLERVTRAFPHLVWLNPVPRAHWAYTHSIGLVQKLVGGRISLPLSRFAIRILPLFFGGLLATLPVLAAEMAPCGAGNAEPADFAQIMPNLDLRLGDGQMLRLVGLAPLYTNPQAQQDFAKDLSADLQDKTVLVQLTGGQDRWGRRSALVFFEDASQAIVPLAHAILAAGGARFKPEAEAAACRLDFVKAERAARDGHKGLWNDGTLGLYPTDLPDVWRGLDGHFIIAEGQARRYGVGRSRAYVDFGDASARGRSFSINILKKNLKSFESHGISLEKLPGHTVRVRGVLDLRFGPRMDVTTPDAIEIDP
eukprot:gene6984-7052_t